MDALSLPLSNHMLLVVGTRAVSDAMLDLTARMALRKPSGVCSIRVVDGGNLFNAYEVARAICRQMTAQAEASHGPGYGDLSMDGALRRIHLSRAFTCYQMVTLLEETPLEVEPQIRRLAWLFFFGVDNTPSYGFSDGRIEPELVDAWRRLATLDRGSSYRELARGLVARVRVHGGRIEAADGVLFQRHGFENEFRNCEVLDPCRSVLEIEE